MKTKTKSKIKKNKIPICPKKEKPVKKIIKIIPKNHNIKIILMREIIIVIIIKILIMKKRRKKRKRIKNQIRIF